MVRSVLKVLFHQINKYDAIMVCELERDKTGTSNESKQSITASFLQNRNQGNKK